MKLTNPQIEALYKFTRQHYVYHYDVQTELVDHLANDIEQIWLEFPKLSFEEARDKSFKKFGIFGFMDVVEAKQKQMNKRYWKIILRFTKEWFTIPKIGITLLIFLSFFLILQLKNSNIILLSTLALLVVLDIVNISVNSKKIKRKQKNKEKVFLLEAILKTTRHSYSGLLFIQFFNLTNTLDTDFTTWSISGLLFISTIITLLIILFYVANYIIPEKAEELLQETYPEYEIVDFYT